MFSINLYNNLKIKFRCNALLFECQQRLYFKKYIDEKDSLNAQGNRKIKLRSLLICHSHPFICGSNSYLETTMYQEQC